MELLATLQARLAGRVPGARLARQQVVPGLELWLLSPDYPRGPLSPEVAAAVVARPAYWAFCWASGRALAGHLLTNPALVHGRRVLDLGAGSGVAGIAAALAGAARVTACDTDADALLASRVNAHLNAVALDTADDVLAVDPADIDLVLLADVLYDPANLPLLTAVQARFSDVLLADSRVAPERLPGWHVLAEASSDTVPDLDESPLYREVRFYQRR